VETGEEVDEDEEGCCGLHCEVEEGMKQMRGKKATGDDDDVPGDVLTFFGKDDLKIRTQLMNKSDEQK
jgi:hypothetical protein